MSNLHLNKLLLLLSAAVLVRLPWLFVIPISDAPDEINHLWVIDFLRTHLCLPSQAAVFAAGWLGEYGCLPQLGYLPHVLTSAMFSSAGLILAARCGSLLAALATIVAAYFIGREVFTGNRLLALALPCLLAFQPQFVFVSCYCNNDSTLAALGGWIVYLLIRCLKYGLSMKTALLLSVLLSWLTLCKYSGLSILVVVPTTVLLAVYIHKSSRSQVLSFSTFLVLPYTILTLWWPLRNYYQFNGDILGTQTMYVLWAKTFHRQLNYYMPVWQILLTPRWWRMLFYSFWAVYGHMNKYLWRPVYFAYLAYTIAAAWGWFKFWRNQPPLKIWLKDEHTKSAFSIWLLFAAAFLVNIAALAWACTSNLAGPQGRYLFGSLIPIDALLIAGIALFSQRYGNRLVISFLIYNLAVSCGSWAYLYLLYGFQCQ